jgi:hypothetical protein
MKSLIWQVLVVTSALSAIAFLNPSSASAGEIRDRQVNQQQRIYNGVKQGEISLKEYQNLETREARIAAQRRVYLRDGNLTHREIARLTNEQNRVSQAIYRDRHD